MDIHDRLRGGSNYTKCFHVLAVRREDGTCVFLQFKFDEDKGEKCSIRPFDKDGLPADFSFTVLSYSIIGSQASIVGVAASNGGAVQGARSSLLYGGIKIREANKPLDAMWWVQPIPGLE